MSRNRQVWPREQVAHLWANASHDSARDPSGNMYFNGPALYSYGSHYVIGYRYATPDGGAFFVMNDSTNSATTNKMRWIARRAIYGRAVYLAGLDGNAFSGRDWRARMMRDALAQAGREYDAAADRPRDSAARRGHVADAIARIEAADAIARAVLADKSSAAEDKRAARATLRTLETVAGCAADTRDGWAARAGALVRDEKRAEMLRHARIATERAADACDSLDGRRSWQRREQAATDAANAAATVRGLAKRYGFRAPRLPDVAAIAADIAPHARAERVAQLQRDARESLKNAESCYRMATAEPGDPWHASSARRYAEQVADAAGTARSIARGAEDGAARALFVSGAEPVPAWITERAAVIRRRMVRRSILAGCGRDLESLAAAFVSAESYAEAGHARDAAREYGRAVRMFDAVTAAIADAPRHPAAVALAGMADKRDAAAAYVATLAERVAAENAAAIAAWRDGASRPPAVAYQLPPMLRLSSDGRSIETSHGAIVPVSIAPRLWRLIESARGGDAAAVSAAFRGLHVGPFTLSEIRADGSAVIGCHDIPHAEMAALAARLNLAAH